VRVGPTSMQRHVAVSGEAEQRDLGPRSVLVEGRARLESCDSNHRRPSRLEGGPAQLVAVPDALAMLASGLANAARSCFGPAV